MAEIRLALAGENTGDCSMLPSLDELVNILHRPIQAPREGYRQAALAGCHESDEIDLIDRHMSGVYAPRRSSRSQSVSSVAKNPGYEMSTASAPAIMDGRSAPSAAMAKA